MYCVYLHIIVHVCFSVEEHVQIVLIFWALLVVTQEKKQLIGQEHMMYQRTKTHLWLIWMKSLHLNQRYLYLILIPQISLQVILIAVIMKLRRQSHLNLN